MPGRVRHVHLGPGFRHRAPRPVEFLSDGVRGTSFLTWNELLLPYLRVGLVAEGPAGGGSEAWDPWGGEGVWRGFTTNGQGSHQSCLHSGTSINSLWAVELPGCRGRRGAGGCGPWTGFSSIQPC